MAIEAIIYANNGFPIKSENKPEKLCFWQLKDADTGGKIVYVTKTAEETALLIDSATKELKTLLENYNVQKFPYEFNINYKYDEAYAHLARKKEWSDA